MPLMAQNKAWASNQTSIHHQDDQYCFPTERVPHEATILGFPSRNSLPRKDVNPFRAEIIEIAETISKFEAVRLYSRPEEADAAQAMMDARSPNNTNVTIIPLSIVHSWVRDTGPVYVFESDETGACSAGSKRYALDLNFMEWGGKAPVAGNPWGVGVPHLSKEELEDNAKFADRVIAADKDPSPVTRVPTKLSLEGGALEVDGEGTLLFTESSVINDNRNPGMSRKEIFDELQRILGVSNIIPIKGVRDLDITDSHIEGTVRFAPDGHLVISRPHASRGRALVDVADQAIQVLGNATDAKGRKFELHVLDEPDPASLGGAPSDASFSYANIYQFNGGVLIPGFGNKKTDSAALNLYKSLFPDRKVIQVNINAIATTGGGIHCVTQQVPKAMSP